jgi:hypothetical protein
MKFDMTTALEISKELHKNGNFNVKNLRKELGGGSYSDILPLYQSLTKMITPSADTKFKAEHNAHLYLDNIVDSAVSFYIKPLSEKIDQDIVVMQELADINKTLEDQLIDSQTKIANLEATVDSLTNSVENYKNIINDITNNYNSLKDDYDKTNGQRDLFKLFEKERNEYKEKYEKIIEESMEEKHILKQKINELENKNDNSPVEKSKPKTRSTSKL